MANIVVSSGHISSGLSAGSGTDVIILGGGTAISTTVVSGGGQFVSSGGLATKALVSGGFTIGGGEYVSSGGTAVSAILSGSNANQGGQVLVGGIASNTIVDGYGYEVISRGGLSVNATVNSGGEQALYAGGRASSTIVSGGGILGDLSFGTTVGTILRSGGTEFVLSSAVASGTVVSGGGVLQIWSAGVGSATTISSGGTETISAGGTDVGATISSGGYQAVSAGGVSVSATTKSAGIETVIAGGTALGAVVQAGGTLSAFGMLLGTISDAGTVSGGTVGSGGTTIVTPGGHTSGVTVASGGTEVLSAGATAVSAVVQSGGTIVFAGGVTSGLVLSSGATEAVASGAAANALSAGAGVLLLVSGYDTHAVVLAGGTEVVLSGGSSWAATVSSGGTEIISSGGLVSNAAVAAGGTEIVSGGTLEYNGGNTTFSGVLQGSGTLLLSATNFAYAGVPGSSNVGVVQQGGTITVKDSETFGGGYTFSAGGGSAIIAAGQTLTIGGSANLQGGQIDGPGTLDTTGVTSFSTLYADRGLTWINGGTVTDTSVLYESYPSESGSIVISNTAAGTFDLVSGAQIYNYGPPTETFINAGLLAETGSGPGYLGAVVSNTGTVSVASGGSLVFEDGGSFKGTFAGAGTIVLQGGTATLAAGHADTFANLSVETNVSSTDAINVAGAFYQNGGTLTLGSGESFSAAAFNQQGGTLSLKTNTTLANATVGGTDDLNGTTLTLTGSANLTGAFIVGPGQLDTTGITTVENAYLDGGLTWVNSGTVTASDGYVYESYPSGSGSIVISNTATGTFDLISGAQIYAYGGGIDTFINAGILAETGSGTSYVDAVVSNTGTISVSSGGSLVFADGGSFKGSIGGAGTIVFQGGTATLSTGNTDTFTALTVQGVVSSTDSINVTGTFIEQNGSLTLGTGASFSAGTFDQAGGTISMATNTTLANATIDGTVDLDGTTLTLAGGVNLNGAEIVGPGQLDTTGTTNVTYAYLDGGLTWVNSGTVSASGYIYESYPSGSGSIVISNTASGVFDLTSGANIYNYGGTPETFINGGTLANLGNFTGVVSATVNNTGTLTATGGTLELNAGGTLAGTLGATNAIGTVLLNNGTFTTGAGTTGTIADDGTATGLVIASGETWTDAGTILDAGHLRVGNVSGGSLATLAITSGSKFTLTGADSGIGSQGTASITNAGTINQSGPTGLDTISVGMTNTGLIDAVTGTLALTGGVSGTGTMQIESGGTLELGQTLNSSQSVVFNGANATLILEKPASIKLVTGFGVGDRIDLAGFSATAVGTTGDVLTVTSGGTSYTFTSNESLAGDHAQITSDGSGGSIVTLYAGAQASAHVPEPVVFANAHVGDTVSQGLTITNAAPAGPYTEALDASLGSATTGFTATGTITGLAGGATNTTALIVGESTTNAGTLSGTAVLTLASDGTGIDGSGITPLPPQTVTMNGAVYAYASPILSTGTISLGAARVGGVLSTGSLTVSNGTSASAYQESLLYGATGPGALTLTNASGTIAAGGNSTLGVSLSTTTAGNFTGEPVTVGLTSTGAGTSGLANTVLASDTVTVNGEVFAPAVAQLGTTAVSVGIIHVGQTVTASVGVTNAGTGALVDLLTAGTSTVAGQVSGVSYTGLGTGVTAGSSGTVSLSVNTATAGTISGSAVIGFDSHDTALADLAIAGGTVAVTGTIDNYAVAAVEDTGGAGTLTGSGSAYTLNLGTVALNGTAITADLGVINAAVGPADLLGGTFTASGSTAFTNSGTAAFSGLAAGQADTSPTVTLNTGTAGVFTETLVVASTGSNASGYSGALTPETITVSGTVVSTGSTYTLTAAPMTIVGTTGNDTFNATTNTLNSHDSINGNGGVDTLNLIGGGYFDLGAPSTLANIEVVTAQESAAGATVYMRNALNVTLNVTPGGTGSLLIYGGNDSDVYNLGAGSDTVVVGAKTETVNGVGGGTGLVQATAALSTVLVNGGSVGSAGTTTLEITNGGNAGLNNGDTNIFVKLDLATNLGLGTASFITAEGATAGHDTITAGAANQTMESLGGNDLLTGASTYGDTFLGTSAGFVGDTIRTFGGSDTIDITDMLYSALKPLTYSGNGSSGKLGVTDGTHTVSLTMGGSYTLASFAPSTDGHGGTLISFV